jgi:hypothetical protein
VGEIGSSEAHACSWHPKWFVGKYSLFYRATSYMLVGFYGTLDWRSMVGDAHHLEGLDE